MKKENKENLKNKDIYIEWGVPVGKHIIPMTDQEYSVTAPI